MDDIQFKQIIEGVKLRAPIEDFVRERVPELKRAGALYEARCPFHEERTPSFKLDPRRGTWNCYGACASGGDVISFVQRFDGLTFHESLELLARATGIELPSNWSRGRREDRGRREQLFSILERAQQHYERALAGPEGAPARKYLEDRGLTSATAKAFGLGWSAARGNPITDGIAGDRDSFKAALEAGLVRQNDGREYDFFHGRLLIPIRDQLGRVVGFGGRRLLDTDEAGPKYINTPETPLFKKSRLIYGLDRALPTLRRSKHLALVEGYTDVMGAHQVGLTQFAAVLGTSTTEEHAALVRRSGARRVSLVFDGDSAGRKATLRALRGFLPMELDLDVVRLDEGDDPCEMVIKSGAEALTSRLEHALDWFSFAVSGLEDLSGRELSSGVDEVLQLIARLAKPVHREDRLRELAARLELPVDAIRQQGRELFSRGLAGSRGGPSQPPGAHNSPSTIRGADPGRQLGGPGIDSTGQPAATRENPTQAVGASESARGQTDAERREASAYRDLVGAALLDNSLIPSLSEQLSACPPGLGAGQLSLLIERMLDLYDSNEHDQVIDEESLLGALGDHPARELVVPLAERARCGESARHLADGARDCIERISTERLARQHLAELQAAPAEEARAQSLRDYWQEQVKLKKPVGVGVSAKHEEPAPDSLSKQLSDLRKRAEAKSDAQSGTKTGPRRSAAKQATPLPFADETEETDLVSGASSGLTTDSESGIVSTELGAPGAGAAGSFLNEQAAVESRPLSGVAGAPEATPGQFELPPGWSEDSVGDSDSEYDAEIGYSSGQPRMELHLEPDDEFSDDDPGDLAD